MKKSLTENEALAKLASYCSRAERCEFDVRRKFDQWNFCDPIAISNILKKLVSENFLNEERYCNAFIKDKIQYNKWGINKISYELNRKKIPQESISLYLNNFSDSLYEEQLTKALQSKIKTIKYKDNYDLKNKLLRFALSKGYTYDLSKKCLAKIL